MNSDMVKPEKFGHLHLVYHFTVPLKFFIKPFEVPQRSVKIKTLS